MALLSGIAVLLVLSSGSLDVRQAQSEEEATRTLAATLAREGDGASSLLDVSAVFLRARRGPRGFQVRNVSFEALRLEPTCDLSQPRCRAQAGVKVAQSWQGRLAWEEQAGPGSAWFLRSCSASAELLADGSWSIARARTSDHPTG